ncbi:NUDIX hydrolase [Arenimonas composti]|uniref:GDP-mannose pyrophosphatase n=1 Tax=Arenimonas composti TR7-09 = DSM 18010 TaxID=1121013 RepID=A0A091BEH5_9GAMM|nr:NUDIX hydrolase [Arenimonas composti]KFN51078.1 hypothetical protein P873_04040 [Arenimonas composti TR7-09 = DSM 18010]
MAHDDTETLCEGRWLRLQRRGHWEYAERIRGGSAVIVIALTPERKLLFVEQFRVPLGAPTIEMPAGLIGDHDDADTAEAAARRELLEETGWEAAHIEILLTGPTSAGLSNEEITFARATGLRRVHAGGGVDGEDITVHEVPLAEAPAWLAARMAEGFRLDAKLWAGLWLAERAPDGSPVERGED